MSERDGQRKVRLPRFLRRCRCFRMVLGAGVMERVELTGCPRHGHRAVYSDVRDYLNQEATR